MAVRTALETWFSEAMSSSVSFWRSVSSRMASAISGSTAASARLRKSCPTAARCSSLMVVMGRIIIEAVSGQRVQRVAVFAALAASVFLSAFLGFFYFRDNFSTHYPVKVLSADLFRAGEIPYWNFADGGGQPLAGNPNTLTFYPDNILYLFLPAHVAFNLHFLIHLAIAFFVIRALTQSHFAAALYAISGVAVSAAAFYNLIVAVAIIPLAFLGAHRRSP